MGQLQALEHELKDLLFVGGKKPERSRFWGKNFPKRLDVYRNNVHSNWTDTLDSDFPLTKEQFSEDEWKDLSEKYFAKHPPMHWELNASMTPFVSFLKKQKVPPFVKELAGYEWADINTFLHPSLVKTGLGVTNPTASVQVFQHQIFYWVRDGAPPKKVPQQKPEVLVFYRDIQFNVVIEEADPLMLLMLDHFRAPGVRLDELEPVRARMLPDNKVPLAKVFNTLRTRELIL